MATGQEPVSVDNLRAVIENALGGGVVLYENLSAMPSSSYQPETVELSGDVSGYRYLDVTIKTRVYSMGDHYYGNTIRLPVIDGSATGQWFVASFGTTMQVYAEEDASGTNLSVRLFGSFSTSNVGVCVIKVEGIK